MRFDDIQSLTDFQRNAREHIKRLKRTGRPEVLTVNGRAELVVQDARSYQKLVNRVEEAEYRERLGKSIAQFRAGQVRDIDEVLDELKRRLPKGKRRAG